MHTGNAIKLPHGSYLACAQPVPNKQTSSERVS